MCAAGGEGRARVTDPAARVPDDAPLELRPGPRFTLIDPVRTFVLRFHNPDAGLFLVGLGTHDIGSAGAPTRPLRGRGVDVWEPAAGPRGLLALAPRVCLTGELVGRAAP